MDTVIKWCSIDFAVCNISPCRDQASVVLPLLDWTEQTQLSVCRTSVSEFSVWRSLQMLYIDFTFMKSPSDVGWLLMYSHLQPGIISTCFQISIIDYKFINKPVFCVVGGRLCNGSTDNNTTRPSLQHRYEENCNLLDFARVIKWKFNVAENGNSKESPSKLKLLSKCS